MYYAFIPARAGSKEIKNKNLIWIDKLPLIAYAIRAAQQSKYISEIYVSTNSEQIAKMSEQYRAKIFRRSEETASDEANTESALIEFCKEIECENIVFLQATSLFTKGEHIDEAIEQLEKEGNDSILSVVRNHQFLWRPNDNVLPMNYNTYNRPRRQDWPGYFIENGAFYINSRKNILERGCRITDKKSFYEMPKESLFEIDTEEDIKIVEKLLRDKN